MFFIFSLTLLTMKIQNLKNTPIEKIVECFVEAFSDYVVKMPSEVQYWKNRFEGARVNYELSFGLFDEKKLVGFIINGIDFRHGELTAFNTGTGVIKSYRGHHLVDQMYKRAIPVLKKHGVKKCALEVIQGNDVAISVYKRIGFTIFRKLKCYQTELKKTNKVVYIQQCAVEAVIKKEFPFTPFHSWDNSNDAMLHPSANYHAYQVFNSDKITIGYFIINPNNGNVPQLEVNENDFDLLLQGIAQIKKVIKINNVDARRIVLTKNLHNFGFENTIDQFEMEMGIGGF